jgi:transcriptional regulator with XRE-family HTH domain
MGSVQQCQPSHYIRRVRLLLGWTQYDLSKATGIDRSKLSLAENGHLELCPAETHLVALSLTTAIEERCREFMSMLRGRGPGQAANCNKLLEVLGAEVQFSPENIGSKREK